MTYPYIFANESGNQPASQLDTMFQIAGGQQGCLPCTATGSSTVVLTSQANVYVPAAYTDKQLVSWTAVGNSASSGNTLALNGLAALPYYNVQGTAAGTGDIVSGHDYISMYTTNAALNSGAGAWITVSSTAPVTPNVVQPVMGSFKNLLVTNTTAIQAAQVLQSGLFNWWTPPNQPWNQYELPEELKEMTGADEGTTWLGKASDKALRELLRSNFYMAKQKGDTGLATFATDMIIVDESDSGTELFNFVHWKINQYVIEENYKGIVDTGRREIEMTYRQICQKFNKPGDTIPEKMEQQTRGPKVWRRSSRFCIASFRGRTASGCREGRTGPTNRWRRSSLPRISTR